MKALLVKLALTLAGDKEKRKRVWVPVMSIIAGFLALMFLPVAVLKSMSSFGNDAMDQADLHISPNDVYARLSPEQQAQLEDINRMNREIEAAMANAGVRIQTRKAQIIYVCCLSEYSGFNAESYAHLFAIAPNDQDLITGISSTYSVEIDYDQFLRTYTGLMNLKINPYMFDDSATKNCADLGRWADNAYISGWGYKAGYTGNQCEEDNIRYDYSILETANYIPLEPYNTKSSDNIKDYYY